VTSAVEPKNRRQQSSYN